MKKPSSFLGNLSDEHWAVVIFLVSMALYCVTLAPTVVWGDGAGFALMVDKFLLDPAADGHPLYIILGRIFSWLPGELAINLNFMSAFFAAVTVSLSYLVSLEITGNKMAAALGAIAFSLSHAFWLHAVTTEVYTLNACFVMGILYLLLKWKRERRSALLYWGAFLYGLSLSHHMIIGLLGAAVLYFLLTYDYKIFTDRRIIIILLCFALGLSIYLGVLFSWIQQQPEKTQEIADIATGRAENKAYMMNIDTGWKLQNIGMYIAYLFYQYPVSGFALIILGLVKFLQENKKLAGFFLLAIVFNAGFFILGPRSLGSPNYAFYIQDYAVFSVFIAYGGYYLLQREGTKIAQMLLMAILLAQTTTYQITPGITKTLGLDLLHTRRLPYRDNEQYFLNPSKLGYKGPKEYAYTALGQMETGATIIADYTPATVLDYYHNILGVRPDIKLVYTQEIAKPGDNYDLKPYVDEHYHEGAIYLADLAGPSYYNVGKLEKEYDLLPMEPIYKIVRKE
ncbi:MAG: DUF2723 domain-containing protein [Candidatus Schekmanbacteria bacterium]|nr:DUF2723 domain-containing protein [Candidatus Schekmanbacteria bacterium]